MALGDLYAQISEPIRILNFELMHRLDCKSEQLGLQMGSLYTCKLVIHGQYLFLLVKSLNYNSHKQIDEQQTDHKDQYQCKGYENEPVVVLFGEVALQDLVLNNE